MVNLLELANEHDALAEHLDEETQKFDEKLKQIHMQVRICQKQKEEKEEELCGYLGNLDDAKQQYYDAQNEKNTFIDEILQFGENNAEQIKAKNDLINKVLDTETSYEKEIIETNKAQEIHYSTFLPEFFDKLHDLNEEVEEIVREHVNIILMKEKELHSKSMMKIKSLESSIRKITTDVCPNKASNR